MCFLLFLVFGQLVDIRIFLQRVARHTVFESQADVRTCIETPVEFIDAAREDFAPAVHQQHAIGDALDEIHLVRAEDDGGAVGAELAHQSEEELLTERIETGKRLVEDRQHRLG